MSARASHVLAAVVGYAADVRAIAVRGEPLDVSGHRERMIYERRRVGRIDADRMRTALEELLDAVERVVDCIEAGDHVALATRVLDATLLQLEKLSPARLVAGSTAHA